LLGDGSIQLWGAGKTIATTAPNYGQSIVPANAVGVTGLALGAYHTVICKSTGVAQAWGSNTYGQTTIPGGLTNVVSVAAGYFHNLALKSDAKLIAWGYNNYLQTSVPADLPPVTKIACGSYHSVALTNAGRVVCWGAGSIDLGNGLQCGQSIVPSDVKNVVEIAGGGKHTVVRLASGLIRSWGLNTSGQCDAPAGYHAESISAGNEFTIGIFNQFDQDADGVIGYLDNCPLTFNADQTDCDADGFGDICGIALGFADDVDLNQVPDFCQYLYGDLNLDGVIDSSDLGGLLGVFGETGLNIRGDLNQDQVVDSSDMGAMLARYGPVP
jgi:alpha-tubulin suppressor-like RCC1 family protein